MASEAADGKPIGHHFAEWWNGVPGRRSARGEGGLPSNKCLRGNLEPGSQLQNRDRERKERGWVGSMRLRRLGWRESPAGGGPFPTGHRCSSVEGTNLLLCRALP